MDTTVAVSSGVRIMKGHHLVSSSADDKRKKKVPDVLSTRIENVPRIYLNAWRGFLVPARSWKSQGELKQVKSEAASLTSPPVRSKLTITKKRKKKGEKKDDPCCQGLATEKKKRAAER